jgi:mercuric reductase
LAQRLIQIFRSEGIDVITRARATSIRPSGHRKCVTVDVDGRTTEIEAEDILVATGKTPNTAALGLDSIGVALDRRGAIVVSNFLQTAAAHICAVGDVASLPARLEMTAGHEGTLAAENALTGSKHSIDYDAVPYTVFTDPQLAGVGLAEDQQMERLGVCACRTVPLELVPKALILKRPEGLVKMAIHPDTGQIMGVHLLAPQAGELVAQAVTLIRNRNTIQDLLETLPMFPTLSEALKLTAMAFTRDISKVSCCV